MAGQTPSRREVLEALGLAAIAGFAPGFCKWSFAQDHASHRAKSIVPVIVEAYKPVGFDRNDYATVEMLCELILPADGDSPGAAAAGVAEFIDFMVSNDPMLAKDFRVGLAAMNVLSHKMARHSFAGLDSAQQRAVLNRIAYRKNFHADEEPAQQFFRLARKYTVMGYYTSETGYKALDSPNLKFYSESPGCAHPDDPEHLHTKGTAHA